MDKWAPGRTAPAFTAGVRCRCPRGTYDRGSAARLRPAAGAARAIGTPRAVVAVAADPAAAAPDRVPADAPLVRHCAARGDPVAYAVVADPAAIGACRAHDLRLRGSAVEAAARDRHQGGPAPI